MKPLTLCLLGAPLLALAIGAGVNAAAGAGSSVDVAAKAGTGIANSTANNIVNHTANAASTAPATLAGGPAGGRRPVLLTGEVEALDSQPILVPPSNSSPLVLRNFVAEGSHVKAGDLLLRIETAGAGNVDALKASLEQTRALAERETANLEVGAVDADKAVVSAQAALAKARVDAALPKLQVSALNYDKYQAELDRAARDLEIKRGTLANAVQAVARRREDSTLEVKKLQINLAYQIAQLSQSEVRAKRDGVVVHGYSPWKGERFDEGATAWPGNVAGTVLGDSAMAVVAWVLEADRPYLAAEQAVSVRFDALPGSALQGRVTSITGAPEARASWGRGRYFRVKISLPENHRLPLVAGMSVLVEPLAGRADASAAIASTAPAGVAAPLTVEGEIASRGQVPVSPPAIPYVWQYKLAQLAPEGMLIDAGQPIARFEASEVQTRLLTQQGALKEKQRALDKLRLDQAEADRADELAVAEARSNAEKAERKATQPKELIRRVDYDKLVIERVEMADLGRLALTRRAAQQRARSAELSALRTEIAQMQTEIATLSNGIAAMTVRAPRKGLVVYRTSFDGDKFSVGSQVWMGLSVATLADPDQLYVAASVPEAQSSAVRLGQAARVTVSGSNQTLTATVVTLGRAYHGKSSAQSTIVRDIELRFDGAPTGLKPGAAVQAVLLAAAPSAAKVAR